MQRFGRRLVIRVRPAVRPQFHLHRAEQRAPQPCRVEDIGDHRRRRRLAIRARHADHGEVVRGMRVPVCRNDRERGPRVRHDDLRHDAGRRVRRFLDQHGDRAAPGGVPMKRCPSA